MLAKSIAIIDDEADVVNLFREALQLNGFNVCTFTDPQEALDHINKKPNDYGLIISDFRMPVINGDKLCFKLKELNSELKVILMSAYTDVQYDKTKVTFINKPISITQLLKIVKDSLSEEKPQIQP